LLVQGFASDTAQSSHSEEQPSALSAAVRNQAGKSASIASVAHLVSLQRKGTLTATGGLIGGTAGLAGRITDAMVFGVGVSLMLW